ncbi:MULTISPECIES: helix-turn-helix domain-containing protein [unclassified Gordonia (in: high G+C Gram-positive bacteria)]|uniref:helix-turn-helix domain-containing protein n=1 Tax=unclassified Gordonia (in: high G+C Gram-positive bacteria) TaxID=2657482 RepID=UPI000815E7F1|nr:transcriptional regulator, XRE family [Gordonia sp. v-85]
MSLKRTIDTDALYAALDAVRRERGVSMRQLAKDIGVSPSLLSRLANGYKPDAEGLMTLTAYLKIPAERFVVGEPGQSDDLPSLMTEIAPLLRARPDLDADDVKYLEDVIDAAVRLKQAVRSKQ